MTKTEIAKLAVLGMVDNTKNAHNDMIRIMTGLELTSAEAFELRDMLRAEWMNAEAGSVKRYRLKDARTAANSYGRLSLPSFI